MYNGGRWTSLAAGTFGIRFFSFFEPELLLSQLYRKYSLRLN